MKLLNNKSFSNKKKKLNCFRINFLNLNNFTVQHKLKFLKKIMNNNK